MHRLNRSSMGALFLVLGGLATAGCGGGKEAESPDKVEGKESPDGGDGEGSSAEAPKEKKDECGGFDVANLEDMLLKSSCEVANTRPDSITGSDLKGKLEVTLTASPTRFAPGGKGDLLVTFANKTKEPLTLHFRIDPVPRFEVEAYDAKSKRADMPASKPPNPPKGHTQPPPTDPKVARITLVAGGSARARVPWEAVKMKWAPDKVRGTPAEKGFPRAAAGPLSKGKYTVKVVTPLVGISEGSEHEMSTPKVEIEVGG